jgi:hypothetical protein
MARRDGLNSSWPESNTHDVPESLAVFAGRTAAPWIDGGNCLHRQRLE